MAAICAAILLARMRLCAFCVIVNLPSPRAPSHDNINARHALRSRRRCRGVLRGGDVMTTTMMVSTACVRHLFFIQNAPASRWDAVFGVRVWGCCGGARRYAEYNETECHTRDQLFCVKGESCRQHLCTCLFDNPFLGFPDTE